MTIWLFVTIAAVRYVSGTRPRKNNKHLAAFAGVMTYIVNILKRSLKDFESQWQRLK